MSTKTNILYKYNSIIIFCLHIKIAKKLFIFQISIYFTRYTPFKCWPPGQPVYTTYVFTSNLTITQGFIEKKHLIFEISMKLFEKILIIFINIFKSLFHYLLWIQRQIILLLSNSLMTYIFRNTILISIWMSYVL